jgi:hypothetical protein
MPSKPTAVLPQPPAIRPSAIWSPDAVTRRVRELSRCADNLSSDAKLLPGRDAADHERIMQRIFSDLLQTLPLLADPRDDRGVAMKLKTIQDARSKLANGTKDLAIEPIIDGGLSAAGAALADISQGEEFRQADLGALLDKLSAQLNRQEVERRDNLHRVDVADAVDQISLLISKMAASLSSRIAAEAPTIPTSQPTATTKPAATMPADEMMKK